MENSKFELLTKVLTKCSDLDYTLLYAVMAGSHAYGNATENSDIDIRFVYAAGEKHYLGFHSKDHLSVDGEDISGYELLKFVKLACANNPSVLELLFTDEADILYVHDYFKPLLEIRDRFLSQKVINSYLGYARGQMQKARKCTQDAVKELEWFEEKLMLNGIDPSNLSVKQEVRNKPVVDADINHDNGKSFYLTSVDDLTIIIATIGDLIDEYIRFKQTRWPYSDLGTKRRDHVKAYGYDTKNVSHAVRLVRTCAEIITLGKLIVKRPDAQYLLDIKQGLFPLQELIEDIEYQENIIKQTKEPAVPKDVDIDLIEATTIEVLKRVLFNVL